MLSQTATLILHLPNQDSDAYQSIFAMSCHLPGQLLQLLLQAYSFQATSLTQVKAT